MKTINYVLLLVAAMFAAGCTKQRDLYVETSPMLVVKADWSKSTPTPDGATALVYNAHKTVLTNPYMQPSFTTQPQRVAPDRYDILVFNNLMFSPTDNEFDCIDFKHTDRFDTFEAHATLSKQTNALFLAHSSEVIVNNPNVIAVATYRNKVVEDDRRFVMKYEDGKQTGNYAGDYVKDEVRVTPVRLTRTVQVIAGVKNYKPGFTIYGSLRGFAQGVNLSTRKPVGSKATHAGFAIHRAIPDPEHTDCHILTSDAFTSFGPWWGDDAPTSNSYTLELLARYNGQGEVFSFSFDVTKYSDAVVTQGVDKAISTIQAEESAYRQDGTIPQIQTIVLEVWLTLPEVIGDNDGGIDVGIEDWGEVVIIPVPIRF